MTQTTTPELLVLSHMLKGMLSGEHVTDRPEDWYVVAYRTAFGLVMKNGRACLAGLPEDYIPLALIRGNKVSSEGWLIGFADGVGDADSLRAADGLD